MKQIRFLIICMFVAMLTVGCSTEEKETVKDVNSRIAGQEWLANVEYNGTYIRHPDNTLSTFYTGYNNFGNSMIADSPSNGRVMWFKEDFSYIPTMYSNDTLIFCTQNELTESFSFERFEDMGYSFGVIGLGVSPTGRFKLSTDPELSYTFPGGDTDCLLNHEAANVIIDSLGRTRIRASKYNEANELVEEGNLDLTRCGSIVGVDPGRSYDILLYEGTEGYHYTWTADVRILASMETFVTNEFEFESETIITIKFPEYCNSGYYMINGLGIFRYIKEYPYETRQTVDVSILNLATPNEYPIVEAYYYGQAKGDVIVDEEVEAVSPNGKATSTFTATNGNSTTPQDSTTGKSVSEQNTKENNTYTVKYDLEEGMVNATVLVDGDDSSGVYAHVLSPNGDIYSFSRGNNNTIACSFYVSPKGRYEIVVEGLKGRTCRCNVGYYTE